MIKRAKSDNPAKSKTEEAQDLKQLSLPQTLFASELLTERVSQVRADAAATEAHRYSTSVRQGFESALVKLRDAEIPNQIELFEKALSALSSSELVDALRKCDLASNRLSWIRKKFGVVIAREIVLDSLEATLNNCGSLVSSTERMLESIYYGLANDLASCNDEQLKSLLTHHSEKFEVLRQDASDRALDRAQKGSEVAQARKEPLWFELHQFLVELRDSLHSFYKDALLKPIESVLGAYSACQELITLYARLNPAEHLFLSHSRGSASTLSLKCRELSQITYENISITRNTALRYVVSDMRVVSSLLQRIDSFDYSQGISDDKCQKKMRDAAEKAEETYRISAEARLLRLLKELELNPDKVSSEAARLSRLLKKQASVDTLTSMMSPFEGKLTDYESLLPRFSELLAHSELATFSPDTAPADSKIKTVSTSEDGEDSVSVDGPAVSPAVVVDAACPDLQPTNSEASAHTDQASVESLTMATARSWSSHDTLELYGITTPEIREKVIGTLGPSNVDSILVELEQRLGAGPLESILAKNPLILLEGQLKTYAKKVESIAQLGATLGEYSIFDPVRSPEHFAYPEVFERTQRAATLLKAVIDEVGAESVDASQTSDVPYPEQQSIPASEQVLIDRLAELRVIRNPLLAYGLIRFGFNHIGTYSGAVLPEQVRDNALRSVFTRQVLPGEIRDCEKQLVRLGFIARLKGGNAMRLCAARDIENGDLRDLFMALIDNNTYPRNLPRLDLPQ